MKGFMMTLEIAEKFYKRCAEQGANTLQERLAIMHQLIHEEDIRIVKEKQVENLLKTRKIITIKHNRKS